MEVYGDKCAIHLISVDWVIFEILYCLRILQSMHLFKNISKSHFCLIVLNKFCLIV